MTTVDPVKPARGVLTPRSGSSSATVSFRDTETDLLRGARTTNAASAPLATAVRCLSAAGARRLGGDAYAIVTRGEEMLLLVADARGKGDAAAPLARLALTVFRTVAANVRRWDATHILNVLDETVHSAGDDEDFMTAVLVHAQRGGQLEVLSCGHPAPVIVSRSDVRTIAIEPCRPLGLGSAPVAVFDRLAPGDRLLLFTDGVCEALDLAGNFFNVEEHAVVLRCDDVEVAVDALLGRLVLHTGGGSQDDVTVLVAARRAEADSAAQVRPSDRIRIGISGGQR